jgi:hypothetical protein
MEMAETQSAAGAGKQGFLLQGKWTTSEKTYSLKSPYDGSLLAEVCNADPSQVEQALAGAAAAFESFRKLSAYARATILRKLSDLIRQNGGRLANLLAREVATDALALREHEGFEQVGAGFLVGGNDFEQVLDAVLSMLTCQGDNVAGTRWGGGCRLSAIG